MDSIFHKISTVIIAGYMTLTSLLGINAQTPKVGVTIPVVVAVFQTQLAASITTSDTSMTLVSGTDKAGNSLSGYICFNIDEGTSIEEFVCGTTTGTAVTGMIRGIDPVDGVTERSTLKKRHGRGGTVKITNFPQLAVVSRALNGTVSIPNLLFYTTNPCTAGSASTSICSKAYSDELANQGAATATNLVSGISKLSVAAASANNPIVVGDNDTRVPPINTSTMTAGQVAALVGSSSTPSASNMYITALDVGTTTRANVIVRTNSSGVIDGTFINASSSLIGRIYYPGTITATTSVFSATVPANTLSSNGVIKVSMPMSATPSASAGNVAMSIFYGNATTTLWLTCPAIGGGSGVPEIGEFTGYVSNISSTTAQRVTIYPRMSTYVPTASPINVVLTNVEATTSIDTTASQTLRVAVSGTNCNASFLSGLVEIIK